jgi:hypothetical protein
LRSHIDAFIEDYNEHAKPFAWDQIRGPSRLSDFRMFAYSAFRHAPTLGEAKAKFRENWTRPKQAAEMKQDDIEIFANYCVFMRSIYLHACELFETSRR